MTTNFTVKDLAIYIKNGMTIENIAKRNNCSADDVNRRINQIAKSNNLRRFYLHQLSSNEKKNTKVGKSDKQPKQLETATLNEVVETICEFPEENIEGQNIEEQNLEVLKEELQEKMDELNKYELMHKEAVASRRRQQDELVDIKKQLLEYKKLIEALQQRYLETVKVITEKSSEMQELDGKCQRIREDCEFLNLEIEELSTVIIIVDNSSFLVGEKEIVDVEGATDLIEKLRMNDAFEELTGKQLKTIAKLYTYVQLHNECVYKFEFMDEQMKEAYNLINKD